MHPVPVSERIVYPARNELGIAIRTIGKHRYAVVDNYGIPLVEYMHKPGACLVVAQQTDFT